MKYAAQDNNLKGSKKTRTKKFLMCKPIKNHVRNGLVSISIIVNDLIFINVL